MQRLKSKATKNTLDRLVRKMLFKKIKMSTVH